MPSIAITRQYEAVYILRPDATDEQVDATINKYRQAVLSTGGTVEKSDRWERRKLAYEVGGYTEGLYVIMEFSGDARTETELRRQFQIGEDQIRYMIVKRDDATATAAASAPAAAAPVAAPAPAAAEAPVPVAETVAPVVTAEAETAPAAETQAPAEAEATPEETTETPGETAVTPEA